MSSSPLSLLTAPQRAELPRTEVPRTARAMSATLVREPFSDPGWIFERKLDGIRCVAIRDGGSVQLLSRNDLSLNARFPAVVTALEAQPLRRFVLDGEVVAFSGGRTSFARLAGRGQRAVTVHLYLFDVLWLDGCDVRGLALRDRKRLLRAAVSFSDDTLHLSTHRNGDGEAYFRYACRHGWEGLVAKRADSPYVGRRSRDWVKLKCEQGQELVVGGYTTPRGSRTDFGALLLGYYERGALRYAGKVGTGFDAASLRSLGRRLRGLEQADSPFAEPGAIRERGVHWVSPELVAQLAFTEWTSAGRLRHPRFLGLRDDKPAADVVRERPT
ncbi:MAG TPA: non-homologous end-joining DNA ligase [Solirubrobacteraceae bacterium]|nr:non-homologous end-joining DNA ligase [Solirubrobacteraceae bacterium]